MDTQVALDAIVADAERGNIVFPTNADVALRVRQMLEDPDCAIDKLCQLISTEPLLSARVLGVANSVTYNPTGKSTTNLRSAVSRIGFQTLRALATAVVVRQMQGMPSKPEHRKLAARLWEHSTQVATLARVIAKRITGQDPEAAFFAGIVHEVGGFYLLSRANDFPALLDGNLDTWLGLGEARVGRAVLRALEVPAKVSSAIEVLWDGYLAMPPESLGDTLLLADELATVESPFAELSGHDSHGAPADIELQIGEDMLKTILADAAEEIALLIAALGN